MTDWTANEICALRLIDSGPRELLPAGHNLINRNIRALLSAGVVSYAPREAIAYSVTPHGRNVLARYSGGARAR